ncbi:TolC family protein [Mangrovibacter plantisponsor]|uniref:Outer membrane protein n=1 Tax=Mangrovibacter plantisponsor TaxID=451513 RepID=A0A317PZP0_9ENTR|nr:TolC family protein [Mangrovibacter plantisponsor]PWW07082.1 outer membrane protein [Mangrovibacter plantisponsor]
MKIRKFYLCVLAYVFPCTHSYAISLEEAVLAANTFNPEMSAARNQHDADQQKRNQGFAGLLPDISLNGSWSQTDQPNASYAAGVTRHNASVDLNQSLFDMSKFAAWKKGDAIAEQADVQLLQAQQKLIKDTVISYFQVIHRRALLNNKRQIVQLYQQKLNQAKAQLGMGDATRLDVADAQASLDKAQADIVNAQSDLDDAATVFYGQSGRSADEIEGSTLSCIPGKVPGTKAQLLSTVLNHNLDIRNAWFSVRQSEADVLSATGGHLPVVRLQAGYGTNWSRAEDSNALDELFGTTSKTRNTSISLNVSIPLFSGGNALSQSIEAAKRHSQSKDLLALAQLRATQDLNTALNARSSGMTRLAASSRLVDSTKARLDSTRYGKEIGMRTLIDELDALNEYAAALNEKSDAQFSLIQAQTELDSTLGELSLSSLHNYQCTSR